MDVELPRLPPLKPSPPPKAAAEPLVTTASTRLTRYQGESLTDAKVNGNEYPVVAGRTNIPPGQHHWPDGCALHWSQRLDSARTKRMRQRLTWGSALRYEPTYTGW